MEYLGNLDLLKLHKTAFLCSQKCPADVVLKSYSWAKEQRSAGNCIVCGNHSQIEKDVFDILLRGNQPLIMVLPRGLKSLWSEDILKAIQSRRLLVVTPFKENVKHVTCATSKKCNETILSLADRVVVGYANCGGQLEKALADRMYLLL
jgi:predicted Rossmann fold nucleotide-binding protein DprA/Smf involved in DNA uptake